MSDLRTAAQQALEFLDAEFGWSPGEAPRIDALRAALAQQAEPVEPVAWVNQANLASARLTRDRGGQGDTHTWSETRSNYHGVPLYIAPPQRKPLTEEEIDGLVIQHAGYGRDNFYAVVRAVERAHGIT